MDWRFLKTDGRMRRTTFGVWCLVLTFLWPALYVVPAIAYLVDDALGNLIGFAIMALGLYVSWCVAVQRAHDMGRGWVFVALTWGLIGASLVLMAVFLAVVLASGGEGISIAVAAVVAGAAGLVLAGQLSLAPPVADDRYGPDPR